MKSNIIRFAVPTLVLSLMLLVATPAFAQKKTNVFGPTSSSGTSYANTTQTSASGGYCAGFTGGGIVASGKNVGDILKYITCLIQRSVIPLIFALALLVFLWGTVKFIRAEGSEEKAEGRKFMLWGIIGLAVMFSVWGLVNILGQTFGVQNVIPQLKVR